MAVDELIAALARDDVPAARVPVAYALHSAAIDELQATLRESLSDLQPRAAEVPFISSVTGARLDTSILDGDYWFANLRQPVLFEQAIRWSYEHGYPQLHRSQPRARAHCRYSGVAGRFSAGLGRFLVYRLGHVQVSFEAERFRHRAVAPHQVPGTAACVAACAGQQRPQPAAARCRASPDPSSAGAVRQPLDRGLGLGHVTVGPAIEEGLHQNSGRRSAARSAAVPRGTDGRARRA